MITPDVECCYGECRYAAECRGPSLNNCLTEYKLQGLYSQPFIFAITYKWA